MRQSFAVMIDIFTVNIWFYRYYYFCCLFQNIYADVKYIMLCMMNIAVEFISIVLLASRVFV